MGLTTIVMIMVIVWAVKEIANDIGLSDVARKKIRRKARQYDDED